MVDVCCTHATGILGQELIDEGRRVFGPDSDGGRLSRYAIPWRLHRLITAGAYDVVHTHCMSTLSDMALLRTVSRRAKHLHTFHFGNFPHVRRRRDLYAIKLSTPMASRTVAVSEVQRQSIIRHLKVPKQGISIIYNGVEENPVATDPAVRSALRRELGIDDNARVAGCIAVMIEQKGIPILLEAAQQLTASSNRLLFVVVGGGRLLESMKALAARMGLQERVVFTGWRSDAPRFMAAFDVLVSSSLWEAFPMVLLEAMAARKPIVATDVGDNRQAIAHGETGLLVPPSDAGSLASAIATLVADEQRAQALGNAGYARFRERFTATRMAEQYAAVYRELASSAAQTTPTSAMG
jgi:glycosyltransferase involved in cell wall biosynthesis